MSRTPEELQKLFELVKERYAAAFENPLLLNEFIAFLEIRRRELQHKFWHKMVDHIPEPDIENLITLCYPAPPPTPEYPPSKNVVEIKKRGRPPKSTF